MATVPAFLWINTVCLQQGVIMKMFDKIKGSIKTAQDKAKAMGKSATASMKKAGDGAKNLGGKVKNLNPFKKK